jgi:hypothetical protein
MKPDNSIHQYSKKLAWHRKNIQTMQNGKTALQLLDHLGALNLSTARRSKYASHFPALLRMIPPNVDLKTITRTDIETILSTLHSSDYTEWTKELLNNNLTIS